LAPYSTTKWHNKKTTYLWFYRKKGVAELKRSHCKQYGAGTLFGGKTSKVGSLTLNATKKQKRKTIF
jgi:hypothetical protein